MGNRFFTRRSLLALTGCVASTLLCSFTHSADMPVAPRSDAEGTIKVFILAGDESCLEQAAINGRTDGVHEGFYPNAAATKDELRKHVKSFVYEGAWSPEADYSRLTPIETGEVELGEQRTKQRVAGQRGRVPVEMTAFPPRALQPGHTTILRGYLDVPRAGKYELLPGDGDGAFNVTTVDGKEVYRRNLDAAEPTTTLVEMAPGKRYAFETVFFKHPSHAFRVALTDMPGALSTVVAQNPELAFLKDASGQWTKRSDVSIFDAHPIHNNTKATGRHLYPGDVSYGGEKIMNAVGPELMLGHVLGDHYDDPVFIVRFATRHPIWFAQGSRSLGHDFLPPSSGGTPEQEGGWDIIHFNFGVWDAGYKDATSKYFSGYNTTSVEDFEKNLRTMVAKMKKTGATLIWASVTPVWEGEPGKPNADEDAFNRVAEKVMKENGVIINDLNAEVRRQGLPGPGSKNVHDVGNLAPKVTATILTALENRAQKTKPLPRVLMIGDSITGSYLQKVTENLDGKAKVYKNPGNAEDTWNGLEKLDSWLDLNQYLLNGQEYLELVSNVKEALGNMRRAYPEYKNQKVEIAGLIWFQGIQDSKLASMRPAYETNLANLIKDLRRDFNAPSLPVVVATLSSRPPELTSQTGPIRDAQLAIADPRKHPDFAGNVACVDTDPFFRPAAESPGNRSIFYHGNAWSYLEIGKAMGQRMIELRRELDKAGTK